MLDPSRWSADLLSLYSAANLDELIDRTFVILPRIVRCDYVSAISTGAGNTLLKERDSRGRRWSGTFMQRFNQLADIRVDALPRLTATRWNPRIAEAVRTQNDFYRHVMRRQGWRHSATLCFESSPHSPALGIAVKRVPGRRDFSEAELARLESVHRFLAPIVSRFDEQSASASMSYGMATMGPARRHGFVVLDWRGRAVHADVEGRRALARWDKGGNRAQKLARNRAMTVPVALAETCQRLGETLQSRIRRNPAITARCHKQIRDSGESGLLASITGVCHAGPIPTPSFVVEFGVDAARANVGGDTLWRQLTESECDVARAAADGMSNGDIARQLGKSVSSVKFLLHQIYKKLRVASRTQLALLVRGTQVPQA
jgi:DNA-binding CsgD family transcriptional regulator